MFICCLIIFWLWLLDRGAPWSWYLLRWKKRYWLNWRNRLLWYWLESIALWNILLSFLLIFLLSYRIWFLLKDNSRKLFSFFLNDFLRRLLLLWVLLAEKFFIFLTRLFFWKMIGDKNLSFRNGNLLGLLAGWSNYFMCAGTLVLTRSFSWIDNTLIDFVFWLSYRLFFLFLALFCSFTTGG